jgi:hypothetical protein
MAPILACIATEPMRTPSREPRLPRKRARTRSSWQPEDGASHGEIDWIHAAFVDVVHEEKSAPPRLPRSHRRWTGLSRNRRTRDRGAMDCPSHSLTSVVHLASGRAPPPSCAVDAAALVVVGAPRDFIAREGGNKSMDDTEQEPTDRLVADIVQTRPPYRPMGRSRVLERRPSCVAPPCLLRGNSPRNPLERTPREIPSPHPSR